MRHSGFTTYVIQIYCESRDCNARENTVLTSEDGDKKPWCCPRCGAQAKLRWKLPLAAYEEQQRANEARIRRLRDWK